MRRTIAGLILLCGLAGCGPSIVLPTSCVTDVDCDRSAGFHCSFGTCVVGADSGPMDSMVSDAASTDAAQDSSVDTSGTFDAYVRIDGFVDTDAVRVDASDSVDASTDAGEAVDSGEAVDTGDSGPSDVGLVDACVTCSGETGCFDLMNDEQRCGDCNTVCSAGSECIAGNCRYASTGAEGRFAPVVDTALEPGVHHFTTILIPPGVRVTLASGGSLDLRATGDVTIQGLIDLSGGDGGSTTIVLRSYGTGGATARPQAGLTGQITGTMCPDAAPGGDGVAGLSAGCGIGGAMGGGSGGPLTHPGGGGGGFAGGGGGGSGSPGGAGGASMSERGGDGGSTTYVTDLATIRPATGGVAPVPYGGSPGRVGDMTCAHRSGSGGGGGSIGAGAASDLSVLATFRSGSGGGGGGSIHNTSTGCGGGGGGGGGGALRITSPTRIVVGATGRVLASGGDGGNADTVTFSGGGGGGGSGGLIVLQAPRLDLSGPMDATGGAGGRGRCGANGGAGGLGRIRLQVDSCTADAAMITPPLPGGVCMPGEAPGFVSIAPYTR